MGEVLYDFVHLLSFVMLTFRFSEWPITIAGFGPSFANVVYLSDIIVFCSRHMSISVCIVMTW